MWAQKLSFVLVLIDLRKFFAQLRKVLKQRGWMGTANVEDDIMNVLKLMLGYGQAKVMNN